MWLQKSLHILEKENPYYADLSDLTGTALWKDR